MTPVKSDLRLYAAVLWRDLVWRHKEQHDYQPIDWCEFRSFWREAMRDAKIAFEMLTRSQPRHPRG